MAKKQNIEGAKGHHEAPLPQEISNEEKTLANSAHETADNDMAEDAELTATNPNDDLDEGETARLGEDTSLI